MLPVIGMPADAVNATLYCLEGDWVNAGLSGAALVPFLEWGATGVKWGRKLLTLGELGQDVVDLAALYSKGGRVGHSFDVDKLERILRNLEAQGVTVYRGEDAERLLRNQNAGALYWALSGGPGVLVLPDNPTRLQVIEELIHLGQHRRAGWIGVETDALEHARREIEAQYMLLDIAARDRWMPEEVERIKRNLEIWLLEYQKAAGG